MNSRTFLAASTAFLVLALPLSPGQTLISSTLAQEGANASPNEAFEMHLSEWKTLLKDMRTIQLDFAEADEQEAVRIRERWGEMVAQGHQLLEQLRETGIEAYRAAPGQDRELERFLVKLVADDIQHDRHEAAAQLSQAMLESGSEVGRLYDLGGYAAFVINDYDKAEKYLTRASQLGALQQGSQYYPLLDEYREFWEEEQQLRAEEAKADDLPRVLLKTTAGDIVLELFENQAPETVGNFVSLVKDGFYDGLIFHRVLENFMAQGGCPLGTGTGGPGYNIRCECYEPDHRKHFRGSLSMAKGQARDTGGSQFFLTFVPTAHLNGKHTVFGRVIEGLDVLAKIQRVNPDDKTATPEVAKPDPDQIIEATVLRDRGHEYKPNKVN